MSRLRPADQAGQMRCDGLIGARSVRRPPQWRRRTGQRTVFRIAAGGAVASYVNVSDSRSRMPESANVDGALAPSWCTARPRDGRNSRLAQSDGDAFFGVATPPMAACGDK